MSQKVKTIILDIIGDFFSFIVPYLLVGLLLFYDDTLFTFEQRKVLISSFGIVFIASMAHSFDYRDRLKYLQKQITNNIEVGK